MTVDYTLLQPKKKIITVLTFYLPYSNRLNYVSKKEKKSVKESKFRRKLKCFHNITLVAAVTLDYISLTKNT